MRKITKEEREYKFKIMALWGTTISNVEVQKVKNKFNSYKEMYQVALKNDEDLVDIQNFFIEYAQKDVTKYTTNKHFMRGLYTLGRKSFSHMNRLREVYKKAKQDKECLCYNNINKKDTK